MGKGRMSLEKGGFELRSVASKAYINRLTLHTTAPVPNWISFVILCGSIRIMVDRISVNSLCEQDWIFGGILFKGHVIVNILINSIVKINSID